LFEANACCALNGCEIRAEIYEKLTFYTFRYLSVEIIEEKTVRKVIHSQFISPCFSPETRQFGGTQVVQINI
jgi:hypothetical protein